MNTPPQLSCLTQTRSLPIIGNVELGFLIVWGVVIAGLGIGDTVSTYYGVIVLGGTEANPIMDYVIVTSGVFGLASVKAIVLVIMFYCVWIIHSAYEYHRVSYGLSTLLAVFGIVITINNTIHILSAV